MKKAGVAELADAHDSKSCSFGSVGSRPSAGIFFKQEGFGGGGLSPCSRVSLFNHIF